MACKLTPKQGAFALAYIETGNASEAYRRAYSVNGKSENTVHVEASRLLDNPKISLRVAELQAAHRQRHNVTVDTLTNELEAARELAMKDEKGASAAVSAVLGKAKLHGLLVDRSEVNANVRMSHEDALELLK
jgi:phage terminase small subunit